MKKGALLTVAASMNQSSSEQDLDMLTRTYNRRLTTIIEIIVKGQVTPMVRGPRPGLLGFKGGGNVKFSMLKLKCGASKD